MKCALVLVTFLSLTCALRADSYWYYGVAATPGEEWLYLNNHPVSLTSVTTLFAKLNEPIKSGEKREKHTEREIVVLVDKEAPIQRLAALCDALGKGGVDLDTDVNIRLVIVGDARKVLSVVKTRRLLINLSGPEGREGPE